jgi:hypothetical protein
VPALWSGPRRHANCPQIPPIRPPEGRPDRGKLPGPYKGPQPRPTKS